MTHSFIRRRHDFAGIFLFTLAQGLTKKRVRISVLAPHAHTAPENEILDGVAIHRFRYAAQEQEILAYRGNMHEVVLRNIGNLILFIKFLWAFFTTALSHIKKEKPDIVHAHWWLPAGVIAFAAAKLTKTPFVLSLHGTDVRLLDRFKFMKPCARVVFGHAQKITAVSNFLVSKISTFVSLDPKKVQTIPMPILMPSQPPVVSKFKNRLITVARLSPQKGLSYLIDAGSIVKKKGIPFTLTVIGGGEELTNLRHQINALNLDQQIHLEGAVSHDRIAHYLASADIFVLPSIEEGFGLAIVEAMAYRKPVIATLSGGIPEIIQDATTGLLVPPRDAPALARAIEQLLTDTVFARRIADNGYHFAIKNFSQTTIAATMFDLYRQVAGHA